MRSVRKLMLVHKFKIRLHACTCHERVQINDMPRGATGVLRTSRNLSLGSDSVCIELSDKDDRAEGLRSRRFAGALSSLVSFSAGSCRFLVGNSAGERVRRISLPIASLSNAPVGRFFYRGAREPRF